MSKNDIANIQRQLELTLAELKNAHDTEQRQRLLFQLATDGLRPYR
jgi:hypothetical protein